MEIKKGIGVSPGVVISTAVVLDAEDLVIPQRHVVDASLAPREDRAAGRRPPHQRSSEVQPPSARRSHRFAHGKEIGGIFDFHLGILQGQVADQPDPGRDPHPAGHGRVRRLHRQPPLRQPVRRHGRPVFFQERVKDIYDIERRILKNLIGQTHEDIAHLTIGRGGDCPRPAALAKQLQLDRKHVKGFATRCGRTHQSHRHRGPSDGNPCRGGAWEIWLTK